MTASIVGVMADEERLNRAAEAVLGAGAALSSAIMHEDGDRGLELLDAAGKVDMAGDFFMAAGGFPEVWEEPQAPLTAEEAARRADALLRQAAALFPRGSALDEGEFEALIEVWGAIRWLGGWL